MKNQLTKLKARVKNQKGFTLIELMAVIAILAMIVLIAVPAVGSILANAEKGSGEAHIAMIENAGELAAVGGLEPSGNRDVFKFDENGWIEQDESGDDVVLVEDAPFYTLMDLVEEGYLNMDMKESLDQFEDAYWDANPSGRLMGTSIEDCIPIVIELDNGTYRFEMFMPPPLAT